MENTLFGITVTPIKKGNPYHNRKGKYTDKKTARAERAEKERDFWKNRAEYLQSVYDGCGKMLRMKEEENIKLKQLLKSSR